MMIYYVVLGISILAGIAGQMLLKAGSDAPTLVAQILRPSSLLGLAFYGSAAFLYMFALRKIPAIGRLSQRLALLCDRGGARALPFRRAVRHQADRRHRAHHGRGGADQARHEETSVTYEQIKYEVKDGILTVTLNRPDKLNAFTGKMLSELLDAIDRSDRDDEVRAVVFTGPGRGFCAGADLSGGANTFNAENRGPVDPGLDGHRDGGGLFTLRLYDSLKPTIAACNGPAVGVGVTMQLAMDVRLASEAARYGFVFTRRAIVMEACSSWFLPRLVGPQQALEWVMTGRVFPAEEALRGRLVRSIHKPEELLPPAYALAREIADNTAPVSVALNRQMLWKMLGADHPMEAHKVDSKGIYARGKSADVKEGVSAFLEKRPARFPMKVSDGMPSYYPWWSAR
jgi:enoyl-CoA hydratase/carnithine racemase